MTERLSERHVWVLWFQGLNRAPEVVRRCVASWREANPGWKVTVLSEENLGDWVGTNLLNDPRLRWLNHQQLADLVRLDLLSRFGGVWADASCWCALPLDSWVDSYVSPSGFFAFSYMGDPSGRFALSRRGHKGAMISSWFLVSTKGHPLVDRLYRDLNEYWSSHHFSNERGAIARRVLDRLLTRNDRIAQWWFSPLVTDVLRVTPYFALHYSFTRLVIRDDRCRAAWETTPKISSHEPHLPQRLGLTTPANGATLAALKDCTAPVFKLNWRVPIEPGSVLDAVTSSA
ncbi:MAG: capsular polysaccharide synthesis protein [Acidimicrobiales bacterium]|jgi:hypothetical protein